MRFLTTRHEAPEVSFTQALFDGLAPDGGLYVPESIEPWRPDELSRLPRRTLTEIGLRAMRPFTRGEIDPATLEAVIVEALNFEIPLVEIQPGIHALELFHGPTFAFKDVGARVMARLMAALHRGEEPLTILAATSGDTGSAVAHAFHRVPNTRVVILYPDGRVSPTQEAQLTMFNGERGNVRAYAVAGSFDDCHRLTRDAFGDAALRRRIRLTSANSVNVGRLLPQSVMIQSVTGEQMNAGVTRVPELELGGVKLKDLSVAFANAHIFRQLGLEDRPALLLGMNAMRAFDRISIDFAAKKVRFVLPGTSMRNEVRIADAAS